MKPQLIIFVATLLLGLVTLAHAQEDSPPAQTLFRNVKVFDGVENKLHDVDVLIEGNLIQSVGTDLTAANNATVIDGGGRVLAPGLTDAHVHLMLNDAPHISIYEKPWPFVGAQAVAGAKAMLLRGFTTVRDVGGT